MKTKSHSIRKNAMRPKEHTTHPKEHALLEAAEKVDVATWRKVGALIGTILLTSGLGHFETCSHVDTVAAVQTKAIDTVRMADSTRWVKRNDEATRRDSQLNAKLDRNYYFDTAKQARR